MFANPHIVSSKLLDDFMAFQPDKKKTAPQQLVELEQQVICLYKDLKAIKQEAQLNYTPYFINKVMKVLPERYQDDVTDKLNENGLLPLPKSQYEVISAFLTSSSRLSILWDSAAPSIMYLSLSSSSRAMNLLCLSSCSSSCSI